MRICVFTPTFLPKTGGTERMADAICRGLLERGHEMSVLAERSRHGAPPTLPYPVFHYRRPPAQHLWPEALALPLWRVHRRRPFDLVLAIGAYPNGYAASRVKRRLGFTLVVNARGADLYPTFHALRKPRVRGAIAAGYRSADRIIAISGWLTGRLHEVSGDGLPPVDLVYNGVDLAAHDRARDGVRDRPPDFADLGGPPAPPFALHLARLHPTKMHELAVEAVAGLRELFERRGLRYLIVGQGQARPVLERRVAELGLQDLVGLLGERRGPEKAWLLANASFFVTTAAEEGLPNVVLEAMAAGLPIVASDIGPHRELVEGRGWGLLFRAGDAGDLAARFREMIEADPAPMRRAAHALRPRFALEHSIAGYERSCLAALADHGTAAR